MATVFCGYSSNIIFELQIPSISENISKVTDMTDPVLAVINMFQDQPSIKNIRAKSFKPFFSLTCTNEIEIIRGMNVRKNCQLKNISTEMIQINASIC